jgi:hypothetical protein
LRARGAGTFLGTTDHESALSRIDRDQPPGFFRHKTALGSALFSTDARRGRPRSRRLGKPVHEARTVRPSEALPRAFGLARILLRRRRRFARLAPAGRLGCRGQVDRDTLEELKRDPKIGGALLALIPKRAPHTSQPSA